MTVNWGAVVPWLLVAAGAWLCFGQVAAGIVLMGAGMLHAWGVYRARPGGKP